MKSKTTIRLATEHDLAALLKIEQAAFTKDQFSEDQISYLLTDSRATNLLLEYKSEAAASASLVWRKSNKNARLYNIGVDPVFQGKGFGNILLKECEREAIRRGCDKIVLEVREGNHHAVEFYKNHGYTSVRRLKDYYGKGEYGIKMSKDLVNNLPLKVMLPIPYFPQSLEFTCGPACLMMALKYFEKEIEFNRALELALWKESTLIFMTSGFGGTDGYGLALSALKRDLDVFMVMSMDATPLLKSVRRPEKKEVMRIVHNDMKQKAKEKGLGCAFYEFGIEEIISALYQNKIPIVMISTYRLTGSKVPHWVIVTGFDLEHLFIHDTDIESYRSKAKAKNIKIKKNDFLKMTRYGQEVYRCMLLVSEKSG
ncbi:MAG: GNAT family N-acetyltransferase [Calditrichaeota bacterium]|nr:MAG: GNAT family N-acetyltransferase [Calditrichota bacterium]